MRGMNNSSCKTKWKLITHEFRDMYLNGESGYIALGFDPLGCWNKCLIALINS